jgi:hypothetical protein
VSSGPPNTPFIATGGNRKRVAVRDQDHDRLLPCGAISRRRRSQCRHRLPVGSSQRNRGRRIGRARSPRCFPADNSAGDDQALVGRPASGAVARRALAWPRRRASASTFSSTVHCGSERVLHEADVAIARGDRRGQRVGSLPSSRKVPLDGGSETRR